MLQPQYVARLSQHVGPHVGGAHMLWETSNIDWIIMAYPSNNMWLLKTIHEIHIYVRRMYKTSDNEIISHNILYLLLQKSGSHTYRSPAQIQIYL